MALKTYTVLQTSGVQPSPVLVVEDSDDDLFFFRRLIAKAGITAPLAVATDGQQAIDQLAAALNANNTNTPVPRLVFLDLKLPLRSGFEVLQWIRSQRSLDPMAVVVLSSSAEARDVAQAFELGAQAYLVKYPAPGVFSDIVRQVAAAPADVDWKKISWPGLPRP